MSYACGACQQPLDEAWRNEDWSRHVSSSSFDRGMYPPPHMARQETAGLLIRAMSAAAVDSKTPGDECTAVNPMTCILLLI